MDDLIAWIREQIGKLRAEAEQGTSDDTPSEVLAQCDSTTAVLDRYVEAAESERDYVEIEWPAHLEGRGRVERAQAAGRAAGLRTAVRCAALAFQHHAGYQERWKP